MLEAVARLLQLRPSLRSYGPGATKRSPLAVRATSFWTGVSWEMRRPSGSRNRSRRVKGTARAAVVGGVARATVGRVVVVARGGAGLLVGAGCGGDGRAASVVVGYTGSTGTVVVVGTVAVVGGGGGSVGAVAGTVVGVAA